MPHNGCNGYDYHIAMNGEPSCNKCLAQLKILLSFVPGPRIIRLSYKKVS